MWRARLQRYCTEEGFVHIPIFLSQGPLLLHHGQQRDKADVAHVLDLLKSLLVFHSGHVSLEILAKRRRPPQLASDSGMSFTLQGLPFFYYGLQKRLNS